jgi:predicted AlkP superfamily pyrophosphatase or phosphodiesterase
MLLMKSLRARNITSVLMLIAVFAAVALTQGRNPPRVQRKLEGPHPRLVLLIVVDQFRYDYLTRFGDLFGSQGLGRLVRRGADWTHANFDHVPTFTAPGHAVFMTGAYPSQTGIIADD